MRCSGLLLGCVLAGCGGGGSDAVVDEPDAAAVLPGWTLVCGRRN
jgi:hypothetical protein